MSDTRTNPPRTIKELLPEAFARLGLKREQTDKQERSGPPPKPKEYRQEVMRYG